MVPLLSASIVIALPKRLQEKKADKGTQPDRTEEIPEVEPPSNMPYPIEYKKDAAKYRKKK